MSSLTVRGAAVAIALLLGAGPLSPLAAAPACAAARDAKTTLKQMSLPELAEEMQAAVEAEDAPRLQAVARQMRRSPDFPQLPDEGRHGVLAIIALTTLELDGAAEALPELQAAVAAASPYDDVWIGLINAQLATEDRNAAADVLAALLARDPATLDALSDDFLRSFARDSRVDAERRFAVQAQLLAANWAAPHITYVWLDHIDGLLERGAEDKALAVVERIRSGPGVLQLRGLRRYDGLVATYGAERLDIAAAYARDLAEREAAAAAPEAAFDAAMDWVDSLFYAARFDEALAAAEALLARPAPAAGSRDAERRPWLADTRARVLQELGREAEAVVAQREAIAAGLDSDRVSHVINLGWLHLRQGRPSEALAAVSAVEAAHASPYGVMQAEQVRACGGHLAGQSAVADAALAYMREHWRDAPGAYQYTLACRGDADAVAELLIRRLQDPALAAEAALEFHDRLQPPKPTAFDARIDQLHRQVRARPDVRAAFDAVARPFAVPSLSAQF
ncbi:hypothetical protein D8I30_07310 [Brevundimonas naejangsanensis]|uniref:Tetratricopeptide repeat protein n=1 Tax=Brevundimonas naejangsanensis TaxID=588932 RepID=A0A494RHV5_9CAUL|nr:hypothetical protein [Brevundimonas naejangsanensis]AYG95009.1 hypothetical protein D8I30_07310 [Brevundimonas naejangsanensis]